MTQINAYLNFNGNCREAMTFYKDCLGGELTIQTVEGTPMETHCPTAMLQQIMHSSLVKDGILLMASDMRAPGTEFIQGNNMSLSLNCSSEEEINDFYSRLSSGGKIFDSLKPQFWGDIAGFFTDKFGTRWMLNYHKNN